MLIWRVLLKRNQILKSEISAETWELICQTYEAIADLSDAEKENYIKANHIDERVYAEIKSIFLDPFHEDFLSVPILNKVLSTQSLLITSRPDNLTENELIDDFQIDRVLGAGSFGKVYLAKQLSLERTVALKVTPDFGNEARLMAQLEHENIVPVYSQKPLTEKGIRLVCMQYVPGVNLETLLQKASQHKTFIDALDSLCENEPIVFQPSALNDREVLKSLDWFEAICWVNLKIAEALQYAHQRGVLHLDIKPSNVLITPYGRPLLTDFNVSLDTENESAAVLGGTHGYMPPEQLAAFDNPMNLSSKISAKADIYALGKLFLECLKRTTTLSPNLDPSLKEIVEKCLKANPAERPDSANDFARELRSTLEISRVKQALPIGGWFTDWANQTPLFALFLALLIPQFAGSLVNISYNTLRIVSHLTEEQKAIFPWLCLVYNAVIYPACSLYLLKKILLVRRGLYSNKEDLQNIRKTVLNFPKIAVAVSTVGWLPGSFLFPIALNLFAGPVENWVYIHFFFSFVISWWVALTYTFLLTQVICIRSIYPKLWNGFSQIGKKAPTELRSVVKQSKLFLFLAVGIPLIGALMVVISQPDHFSQAGYQSFRILLMALILLGMVGIGFAIQVTQKIILSVRAFTHKTLH